MMAKRSIRKAARKIITPVTQRVEEVAQENISPEPEAPEPEEVEESPEAESSPFGDFDLAGALKMAQPLIQQELANYLSNMDIPTMMKNMIKEELAPTIATINTVKVQLQPMIDAAQQMSGGNGAGEQAPVETSGGQPQQQGLNLPPLGAIKEIINLFKPSNPGGGGANIAQLAEMLKGVQTIAELANAPYRQGRHDALSETNATVKLLQGLGATDEKKLEIIAGATSKEIASE